MAKGMTGFYVEDVDEFFVFDQVYGLFYINRDTLTGKGTECFRADLNPDIEEDEEILNQTRLNVGNVPVVKSELIYKEKDPSFSLEVSSTLSNEYILIKSDNLSYDPYRIAVEFRYRASNKSSGEFLIIQERKEGRNYDVKHQKDFFYLLVSTPEEYNGKVLRLSIPPYSSYSVPPEPLVLPETSEVSTEFLGASAYIPHNENVYIEHLEAYSNHLVEILIDTETSLQYIQVENSSLGTTDIVSYDKYEGQLKVANNKSYRIKMDGGFQDYNDKNFRYVLSTLHSPEQIISYDLDTRTNDVLDYYYTIPGVRLENYTSERIVLPANDGVMIPITLVYHKKNVKTGNNAVGIVQSFGGDIENSHNFKLDYHWYSVLDRGFIWIIPHVRGSNDVNRKWYEQGIQHNKIRHFQDLLDISVSLVAEKIVRGISGYSSNPSGGLALAALIMKEPNLFSATVMRVFFT
jgi:oligopeptidase B